MKTDVAFRLIRRCIETRKFRNIPFFHQFFYGVCFSTYAFKGCKISSLSPKFVS